MKSVKRYVATMARQQVVAAEDQLRKKLMRAALQMLRQRQQVQAVAGVTLPNLKSLLTKQARHWRREKF
ncbi:MAG: hypothetical protein A2W80_04305 [Candidatus Riflebacteria bacterium GWC2_50_8]|nr:MAG: hypothetical protein A2W80_04305 [Candidatus Riflebacteria bacterium GWC2_50_8]